jgi:hypothetical protein
MVKRPSPAKLLVILRDTDAQDRQFKAWADALLPQALPDRPKARLLMLGDDWHACGLRRSFWFPAAIPEEPWNRVGRAAAGDSASVASWVGPRSSRQHGGDDGRPIIR